MAERDASHEASDVLRSGTSQPPSEPEGDLRFALKREALDDAERIQQQFSEGPVPEWAAIAIAHDEEAARI